MARRRRSRSSNDRTGREVHTLTRTDVLPLSDLRFIEDRREFHPLGDDRPAGVFMFREARQVVPSRKRQVGKSVADLLPSGVQFNVPGEVALCVRRKRRREVMFAIRKHGRNGGRRYRRTRHSEVSCSR